MAAGSVETLPAAPCHESGKQHQNARRNIRCAALPFAEAAEFLLPVMDAPSRQCAHGNETLPSRLVAVGTVAVISGLILLGMRRSSAVNIIIVSITVLSLATFAVLCLPEALSKASENLAPVFPTDRASFAGLLQACALMFVAYTGYGRIATMGEEVKEPEKMIPRAILAALAVTALIYIAVCLAAVGSYGAAELGEVTRAEAAPLESVLKSLEYPHAAKLVAAGAMTAMLGVLLNLLLGLSRVILAMGRRGDVPQIFARVNREGNVPAPAVAAVTLIVAGLCAVGDVKLTWSFSAFTVLFYYALTNLAALRMPKEQRRYSPVFPWMGLISCLFLAFWVEWRVWLSGLGVIAIGLIWHYVAVRRSRGRRRVSPGIPPNDENRKR